MTTALWPPPSPTVCPWLPHWTHHYLTLYHHRRLSTFYEIIFNFGRIDLYVGKNLLFEKIYHKNLGMVTGTHAMLFNEFLHHENRPLYGTMTQECHTGFWIKVDRFSANVWGLGGITVHFMCHLFKNNYNYKAHAGCLYNYVRLAPPPMLVLLLLLRSSYRLYTVTAYVLTFSF